MWPFDSKSAEIERRLGWIEYDIRALKRLMTQLLDVERTQMADLSNLTREVSEIGDVVNSAIALLGQLADMIRNAGPDQAALDDLANSLDAKANELAAAVTANTPAA